MKPVIITFLLFFPVLTQASGEKKWGLTYEERQHIWLETMRAHIRADSVALVIHGPIRGRNMLGQIAVWNEISDSLNNLYILDLKLARHITSPVYDSIIAEGIREDWNRR